MKEMFKCDNYVLMEPDFVQSINLSTEDLLDSSLFSLLPSSLSLSPLLSLFLYLGYI